MSVRIISYHSGPHIQGKEQSSEDGFTDLPIDDQITILREEMWEWATGRSRYHPSTYRDTPIPQQQSYANNMIVAKAIQIETLLKIKESA